MAANLERQDSSGGSGAGDCRSLSWGPCRLPCLSCSPGEPRVIYEGERLPGMREALFSIPNTARE